MESLHSLCDKKKISTLYTAVRIERLVYAYYYTTFSILVHTMDTYAATTIKVARCSSLYYLLPCLLCLQGSFTLKHDRISVSTAGYLY